LVMVTRVPIGSDLWAQIPSAWWYQVALPDSPWASNGVGVGRGLGVARGLGAGTGACQGA